MANEGRFKEGESLATSLLVREEVLGAAKRGSFHRLANLSLPQPGQRKEAAYPTGTPLSTPLLLYPRGSSARRSCQGARQLVPP